MALPESWLGEARNAKATVRLWSDRDRSFTARLRELSPQADPATRTYRGSLHHRRTQTTPSRSA